MKIVNALLLAGSAQAFAPQASLATSKSALYDAATETATEMLDSSRASQPASSAFCNGLVGGEGPEPMPFSSNGERTSVNFDPLGFTERSPELINWFREAELKHGRQAMLATVGIVAPEFFRVPGEQFSFEAVPNVLDAHNALIDTSMKQILLWIGLFEAMTFAAVNNMNEFDRMPGDYGFDPLGLKPNDPEKLKKMQLRELKNGRLAMIAIGGMVVGASITGKPFPYL